LTRRESLLTTEIRRAGNRLAEAGLTVPRLLEGRLARPLEATAPVAERALLRRVAVTGRVAAGWRTERTQAGRPESGRPESGWRCVPVPRDRVPVGLIAPRVVAVGRITRWRAESVRAVPAARRRSRRRGKARLATESRPGRPA
jgi:hypothetical protein